MNNQSEVKDYFALTKPGVMSLVIFTTIIAMIAAAKETTQINYITAVIGLLCVVIGSGGSAALNMWYDADIDAIMSRTKTRPIPSGKVKPTQALEFGVIMSLIAVVIMAVGVNLAAATLLAFTIFFYAVIYTIYLKRSTIQNIVIGGAAGAFPPMIGWMIITGTLSWLSFFLFMVIFIWTPPHFWALAIYKNEDYKLAKLPMMPVSKGERVTKINILSYSILLFLLTMIPILTQELGMIYAVSAIILGIIFCYYAIMVYIKKEHSYCKRLFLYSILYLFLLFASIGIDSYFGGYNG